MTKSIEEVRIKSYFSSDVGFVDTFVFVLYVKFYIRKTSLYNSND